MTRKLAVLAVPAAAALLAACGSGLSHGKITGYEYAPPAVQTVNVSCNWYSGGSSGSKYGSTGNSYCLDWNTVTEPRPQDCKITYESGGQTGHADLDVSEAQCAGYVGRQWPLSGGEG